MLEPGDIEAIRCIIREEIERLSVKTPSAIRQKRYRERLKKRNAVTPEIENHSVTRNERYGSPSRNGVTNVTESVTNVTDNIEREEKERSKEREEMFLIPLPTEIKKERNVGGVGGITQSARNGHRPRKPILMCEAALNQLIADPLYKGIDLIDQSFKFERWCKANNKTNTVRRFVNWINNIK